MPILVGLLEHVEDDLAKEVYVVLRHGFTHEPLAFDLLVADTVEPDAPQGAAVLRGAAAVLEQQQAQQ